MRDSPEVALAPRPVKSRGGAERIAVLGLGYVGLPVAVSFARRFPGVIGFDISGARIEELRAGNDRTREISAAALREVSLTLTADPSGLAGTTFFVITVPTPIDDGRRPDLRPLEQACRLVAPFLGPGAVVVLESTVYPGVTEGFCGRILAEASGLVRGRDFQLAYSPERINPGDTQHRLENITKIVASDDPQTLERVAAVYGSIIPAGIHRVSSIKVAEAAKVLENTQRDLNIALMNELAIILDRMGVRTRDVLDAAGTKWNFLPFSPGLVGGHCIGVDPYYLTAAAEAHGYHPEVILAGRRVNDGMGGFVARKVIKLLIEADRPVKNARVGILGLTFKEDVPDLRNSKVVGIINELKEFGIDCLVDDPHVTAADAMAEHGVELTPLADFAAVDAMVLAVNHRIYRDLMDLIQQKIARGGILVDVKSALARDGLRSDIRYWSL